MFAIHEQNVLAQNLSFHSKTSVYAYDPLGQTSSARFHRSQLLAFSSGEELCSPFQRLISNLGTQLSHFSSLLSRRAIYHKSLTLLPHMNDFFETQIDVYLSPNFFSQK
jgi:hypothetical protein